MKPSYRPEHDDIYNVSTLIDAPPLLDEPTDESFEDDVWFCETEQGTRLDL